MLTVVTKLNDILPCVRYTRNYLWQLVYYSNKCTATARS